MPKNTHNAMSCAILFGGVMFMNFPSIVKYSREKLGMSQEEMAHALQISFSTINRWENGKTHPNKMTRSVFFDFCEKHGIKAREMLQEDNQGE
ncbi:helix-turn-helix domain-containing protein [Desulforamulus aeronauticus]|uniref:Helix-turn-helix domain-containing protein n=1 Tax=Desulforamulus aeronauticus DSM 10349 TaxID=1121421 RepID=A0A1M6RAN3_9FIRM|nr:helix-turn-helix domain-containing protein [Desulforamulus aeronauticus]SHK29535.1 Helix-turn-helix domain-containing protein [Desulforamulus aeronauticus DSM 10349]